MRNFYPNFNLIYCMNLMWQVLADPGNALPGERNTSVDLLGARGLREEIKDNSGIGPKNFTSLPRVTSAPFSQSLATHTFNFQAFCVDKGEEDGDVVWTFTFARASCDTRSGDPRRIIVKCNAFWHHATGPARRRQRGTRDFPEICPERSRCQPLAFTAQGGSEDEVACVDEDDIKKDLVTAANSHADPYAPGVHCGLSLALPGNVFTVKPGVQSIDITLTEEARFLDGSPYPAPMLYIRDMTTKWTGFDRVFRRDASVASTRVTLKAVGGKFQTRVFDFCMQLSPHLKASAVSFTYSWFQTTSRHGRVPEQLLLERSHRNDTSQW